jgi:thiol-disulfide isomerase/thioredoxin
MKISYIMSVPMLAAALVAGCSAPKSDGAAKYDTAQERSESTAPAATQAPATAGKASAPPPMLAAMPAVAKVTDVESGGDPSEGKMAPNFTWSGSDGKAVSLKDYRGKVVLINFWGTWCPPCRAELPDIVKIREELAPKGAFEVIGLNVGEEAAGDGTSVEAVVGRFAQQKGIHYPLALANNDLLKAYGGIESVPTTFVLNKNGEVIARMVGMKREEDFRRAIQKGM